MEVGLPSGHSFQASRLSVQLFTVYRELQILLVWEEEYGEYALWH